MKRALALCVAALLVCGLAWALFAAPPGFLRLSPPRLWERPSPPAQERPVVDAGRLHRSALPNGLEVLVLEDRRLPAFAMGVTLKRGAGVESVAQAGLAEFTARLMERGAGERDFRALNAAVSDLGANFSVTAGWDSVAASVSGLSRDHEALLAVLADVVLRPRFAGDEASRVRSEQLAGIRKAGDNPNTLVAWSFSETLYPQHRYGLPLAGTLTSVEEFGAQQARDFHGRIATPRAAVLWAVGDLDAAALLPRLREHFGAWSGGPPLPPAADPAPPSQRRIVVVDRPELGQAQLLVGHEGIARADESRLQVQLLNTVLGRAGFSSRLMGRIRASEGLTYHISSRFRQRRAPGPFAVRTFTEVSRAGELLRGLFEELARIRTEPPGAEELDRAKSLRSGAFALGLETSGAVASALVALEIYGLPRDSLDSYRSRLRAVTPAAVAEAARARIHPERAAIVAVGPAAQLVPQLEEWGEVEVRQR